MLMSAERQAQIISVPTTTLPHVDHPCSDVVVTLIAVTLRAAELSRNLFQVYFSGAAVLICGSRGLSPAQRSVGSKTLSVNVHHYGGP